MSGVPRFSIRQCSGSDYDTFQFGKPLELFPGYRIAKDEGVGLGRNIEMSDKYCAGEWAADLMGLSLLEIRGEAHAAWDSASTEIPLTPRAGHT